jgi:hypothetical protein
MLRRALAALIGAVLAASLVAGCRPRPATAPAPAPSAQPGEREQLLARIRDLDEVRPCVVDGGADGVRLVEADLAGDAAMVRFTCANGAVSGKVTFFRVAGAWTISTKEIAARARLGP